MFSIHTLIYSSNTTSYHHQCTQQLFVTFTNPYVWTEWHCIRVEIKLQCCLIGLICWASACCLFQEVEIRNCLFLGSKWATSWNIAAASIPSICLPNLTMLYYNIYNVQCISQICIASFWNAPKKTHYSTWLSLVYEPYKYSVFTENHRMLKIMKITYT